MGENFFCTIPKTDGSNSGNYLQKIPVEVSSGDLAVIQDRLMTYIKAREDISNILIVGNGDLIISGNPGDVINPWTSIKEKQWYNSALEADGKTIAFIFVCSGHSRGAVSLGCFP